MSVPFWVLIAFTLIYSSRQKSTPKARELRSHFGYPTTSSPYGPSSEFSLSKPPDIHILTENGYLAGESLPHKEVEFASSLSCDIALQPFYSICKEIDDCEVCVSSQKCGWCPASGKCLPGSIHGCSCPSECPSHFMYDSLTECHRSLASGELTNIAPESKKLISPSKPLSTIEESFSEPIVFSQNSRLRLGFAQKQRKIYSNGKDFKENLIQYHGIYT